MKYISTYIYIYTLIIIIIIHILYLKNYLLQFDKNDTMCTFRLENNGFQIRLTVWQSELHMVEKLGKYV